MNPPTQELIERARAFPGSYDMNPERLLLKELADALESYQKHVTGGPEELGRMIQIYEENRESMNALVADQKAQLTRYQQALEKIAETDVTDGKPEWIWYQSWRNKTKEIARAALEKCGGK